MRKRLALRGEHAHVAAGTEIHAFAGQQDHPNSRIAVTQDQRPMQRGEHVNIQSVGRIRTVQLQMRDGTLKVQQGGSVTD